MKNEISIKKKLFYSIEFAILYTIISVVLFKLKGANIDEYRSWDYFSLSQNFLMSFGLYFIFVNGKTYHSKVVRVIQGGILIVGVGLLFKILHLPFASWLILIGLLIILVSYGFRFIIRKPKSTLDYLKVIWVIMYVTNVMNTLLRLNWVDKYHLSMATYLFTYLLIAYFLFTFSREKKWKAQ